MQRLKSTQDDEGTEKIFLPTEIWSEIFYKLPMKSLLQSRCIDKRCQSIIDSPEFSAAYLTRSKNNLDKNHLLICERTGPKGCYGLVFKVLDKFTFKETSIIAKFSKYSKFWGYCNGLVLLQDILRSNTSLLRLWNPSLRRSVILPPCPFEDPETRFVLGFDPCKDDYKVLAFRADGSICWDHNMKLSPLIAIYSCNDRLWRVKTVLVKFHSNFVKVLVFHTSNVQYCKEIAHWEVINEHFAVLFDFGVEEFRCLKFPDTKRIKSGTEMVKFLFFLGDSIAAFCISASIFCIFVIRKDHGKRSWVRHLIGHSCSGSYEFFRRNRFSRIFFEDKSGGTLFLLKDGDLWMQLMSYNLTSYRIQELGSVFIERLFWVDTYVESLVLFKEFNGQASRPCP